MSFDDLQAQLRGALDQQLAALKEHYEHALAGARREAAAESAREADTRIGAARAEWETEVAAMVEATRVEARAEAAEAARMQRAALEQELHQQLEQTVQHAVGAARKSADAELETLRRRVDDDVQAERQRGEAALQAAVADERGRVQQAIEAERRQAQRELEAERTRAKAELETVQQLMEAEIESAQSAAAVAREAAEAAAGAAAAATPASSAVEIQAALAIVPDAVRVLDSQPSVTGILTSLVQHAGAIAGRAALFLIDGDRLTGWQPSVGLADDEVVSVSVPIDGGDLLARAAQSGQAELTADDLPAPAFAGLAAGEPAIAVPLMITGRAVAVLYADTGGAPADATWMDAVELIGRHASAMVSLQSAVRTLDVLRGEVAVPGNGPGNGNGNGNGEESARRYARLLVSEIKLYNEGAVRVGRERRDLGHRLREEIDRALRLYQERVPSSVAARDQFFQQELVQTLADGDATLLGS